MRCFHHFLTVSDVLRKSVDNTLALLRQELEIRKGEILESLHFASLEKIFIEERIYKDKEFEQAKNMDAACEHIDERLTPYYPTFIREVTKEDILRLMEIKMARILKFNSDKAEELIARMRKDIEEIDCHLANIVEYTVDWFRMLKDKYGKAFPRRTELRNFDTIEATKVIEANEKLYINREEGFIGTGLKKDEFIGNCSPIDDVIIFFRDGKYIITPVADKKFVGKNILYANIFKKNDKRTIYNVCYRDGKEGTSYIKRFAVTSVVRDREQNSGEFYATNFDLNNHYDDGIRVLEKYDPNKVWTAVLYDADQQNYPYIKRFCFEATARKQNYLGENKNSSLILLTDECYPRLEVVFGGHDNFREPMVVEADEFIAVKGFKAKGKRLTTYTIETINELEPTRQPEPSQKTEEQETDEEPEILDPDHGKSEGDILDEMTGQMKLF